MTTPTASPAPAHDTSGLLVGSLAFMFAALVWGMNVPVSAELFRTFDPYWISAVRTMVSIAVLGLMLLVPAMGGWKRSGITPVRFLVVTFSLASFFVLYNLGLSATHPITAAAVMAGAPVYAALTARAFGSPLARGFWGAAAMTAIGATIAVTGRSGVSTSGFGFQGGEPVLLLSFVGWNVYSILAQRWFAKDVSQLQRTFTMMIGALGWVLLAWFALYKGEHIGPPNLSPTAREIGYILLTGGLSTGLGPFVWNIGVSRLGLPIGSLWQNTVPIFAVLIAMLFGHFPNGAQVLGGAIVIVGVGYMQWRQRR
ncbi:MAG: DMT family transporter [Burkholderiaceae bacterium]|nr:DMT family transporter [Burkholderiaceae bacterium]